jgi:hypothetical protein
MAGKWQDGVSRASELLVGGDVHRIAESTMELVAALVRSRRAAVFLTRDGTLDLFVSQGVDQRMLDAVHRVWAASPSTLVAGEPLYSADPGVVLVMPCLADGTLVGLLCVDAPTPAFRLPAEQVVTLCGILARSLSQPESLPVAPALEAFRPTAEFERDRLLLLLDRNEWNIARVARILSVTRATIYNRLARFSIPRRHVPKVLPRRRMAHPS